MMDEEEEVPEQKDDSRPFFKRKPGQVGVYIELYDVTPNNPKDFGSRQFLIMSTKDSLFDYMSNLDLVSIKSKLEQDKEWDGVILEGFEKGIVFAVSFETMSALELIGKQNESGKLTKLIQSLFITSETLKSLSASKVVLNAKLWQDEYEACRADLLANSVANLKLKIDDRPKDFGMAQRVKVYHSSLTKDMAEVREKVEWFEKHLGEFLLMSKKVIPQNATKLRNLKEYFHLVRVAKSKRMAGMESIEVYMKLLERFAYLASDIDKAVFVPLLLIHPTCEKTGQKRIKHEVHRMCDDVTHILKHESDLKAIRYPAWEKKILPTEQGLFRGLVSIVPLCCEKLIDIEQSIYEYITDFPVAIP